MAGKVDAVFEGGGIKGIALVGAERRYCGEPPPAACETCVSDAGRFIAEDLPVASLIQRSGQFLGSARQVIAPSRDAASRMRRHFPHLNPEVVPHEDDTGLPPLPRPAAQPLRPSRSGLGPVT